MVKTCRKSETGSGSRNDDQRQHRRRAFLSKPDESGSHEEREERSIEGEEMNPQDRIETALSLVADKKARRRLSQYAETPPNPSHSRVSPGHRRSGNSKRPSCELQVRVPGTFRVMLHRSYREGWNKKHMLSMCGLNFGQHPVSSEKVRILDFFHERQLLSVFDNPAGNATSAFRLIPFIRSIAKNPR